MTLGIEMSDPRASLSRDSATSLNPSMLTTTSSSCPIERK
jgi:hypothetical protein